MDHDTASARGTPGQRDEIFRAIGGFIVAFSAYLHRVELITAAVLQSTSRPDVLDVYNRRGPGKRGLRSLTPTMDRNDLWCRVLDISSGSTAGPVIHVFFRLLQHYGRQVWEEADARVVGAAYWESLALTDFRNRVLHDAMSVLGAGAILISDDDEPPAHIATLWRRSVTGFEVSELTGDMLSRATEDLNRLSSVLGPLHVFTAHIELDLDVTGPAQLLVLDASGRVIPNSEHATNGRVSPPR